MPLDTRPLKEYLTAHKRKKVTHPDGYDTVKVLEVTRTGWTFRRSDETIQSLQFSTMTKSQIDNVLAP